MLAIPLLLLAPLAAAQGSTTPPVNTTATNPWWPQYPDGRDMSDFVMTANASEADLRGESDIAKWIIEASNMFRAQFRSSNVTWNETCARIAQNHTNTCLWEHWGSDNLAQQSGSAEGMTFDVRSMIEMWAVEWDYYPFSHPEREEYSHFTAMTWNASTTVGCGWNINCANDTEWPSKTYFVCNYWPPGNVMTQPPGQLFALNIQNFTGWPVDETKASSISSLAALATQYATQTREETAVTTVTGGATSRPPTNANANGGTNGNANGNANAQPTGAGAGSGALAVAPGIALLLSAAGVALGSLLV